MQEMALLGLVDSGSPSLQEIWSQPRLGKQFVVMTPETCGICIVPFSDIYSNLANL